MDEHKKRMIQNWVEGQTHTLEMGKILLESMFILHFINSDDLITLIQYFI